MRAAGRRSPAILATGVVLLLALAGCGPVDRGTALGDALEVAVRDLPGVTEVSGGGQNPLPWTGFADGTITLDEAASPEQVLAVAQAALSQIAEAEGDLTASLVQPRGAAELTIVLGEHSWADGDLVRAGHAAAALLPAGTVRIDPTDIARPGVGQPFRRAALAVDGVDAAALPDLLPALVAVGAQDGDGGGDGWDEASLALWSADGTVGYEVDPVTSRAIEAVAVLTAAGVRVHAAVLDAGGGTLTVPARAVPEAERLLAAALPDLDLTVRARAATSAATPGTPAPGTPAASGTPAPAPTATH